MIRNVLAPSVTSSIGGIIVSMPRLMRTGYGEAVRTSMRRGVCCCAEFGAVTLSRSFFSAVVVVVFCSDGCAAVDQPGSRGLELFRVFEVLQDGGNRPLRVVVAGADAEARDLFIKLVTLVVQPLIDLFGIGDIQQRTGFVPRGSAHALGNVHIEVDDLVVHESLAGLHAFHSSPA